jgi:hypothetical protein
MHIPVGLSRFDQAGIVDGLFLPTGLARVLVEQPELPAEEAFAPIRPAFSIEDPPPLARVHGEAVRVCVNQPPELILCKIKNLFNLLCHVHAFTRISLYYQAFWN